MHSWLSRTAPIKCKRELYRPSSTPKAVYRVLARLAPTWAYTVTSRRGRETHRHDYRRQPASLGDEVGGLSISLGLFASPPLILSTESVVVMEWKGMSTSTAASTEVYPGEAARVAIAVLMPFPHHDHD